MATKTKVPGSFNADERASERSKREIVIGGQKFHPRKKTMQMMMEWNDVAPSAADAEDPDRDPMENFRDVYKQLQVFLADAESHDRPDLDFLYGELDVEEAVDLLMELQPNMARESERARDLPGEEPATAT